MTLRNDGPANCESDDEALEATTKKSDRQISQASTSATALSLEDLSSPDFFSRQCTEIDSLTCRVAEESYIKKAMMNAAVSNGNFCVTVGDPRSEDVPLIAVSEKFEAMTGYRRCEMLGKNCRFLNERCMKDTDALMKLRLACQTGSSFTGVLTNMRKSGECFLNLLDLRGLTVARNQRTGEDLWFLIGIHADVTQEAECAGWKLPTGREEQIHEVATSIRSKLAEDFSRMAVSGALLANAGFQEAGPEEWAEWALLPTPMWMCQEPPACE
jgi:PAS domain-containing protein